MNSPRDRTTTFPTHAFDGDVYEYYSSDPLTDSRPESITTVSNDEGIENLPTRVPDRQVVRQDAHPTVLQARTLAAVHRLEESNDSSSAVQFIHSNPNESYQPIHTLGWTGKTIISYHKTKSDPNVVAIKRTAAAATDRLPEIVKQPSHKNIAGIVEGFYYGTSRFTVYEYMQMSLDDIKAAPVFVAEDHVATICLEVCL